MSSSSNVQSIVSLVLDTMLYAQEKIYSFSVEVQKKFFFQTSILLH